MTPKSIVTKDFVSIFFSAIFLVAPGITTIYLYFPEQFQQFDATKLILLSVAFTTPIVGLFWLSINMARPDEIKMDDKGAFTILLLSLFAAAFVTYISLIIALATEDFFIINSISDSKFTAYITTVVFMTIVGSISVYFEEKKSYKKES